MDEIAQKLGDKVLIIDDEPRVIQLVRTVLEAVGYEVVAAMRGEAGVEAVALEQPDLILLDIRFPEEPDGYEVCERIREFSDVGVIMLTAMARHEDVLRGFDVGADDYLTKPFNAKELVARVNAVVRRTRCPEERADAVRQCGDWEIDFARHTVVVRGDRIKLTPTEYGLLCQLAKNPNCVMTHSDLLGKVWGPEYRDDVDYLRAYIRYLRRKLEQDPSNPEHILTVQGVGYMLACPAED